MVTYAKSTAEVNELRKDRLMTQESPQLTGQVPARVKSIFVSELG